MSMILDFCRMIYLSITSPAFYSDVYCRYKGYGLKYLIVISFIASFLCSLKALEITNSFYEYLGRGVVSSKTVGIEHVINQFPALSFNGTEISIDEETPIYLTNSSGINVVVIDPNQNIKPADRVKIPFLFNKTRLIIQWFLEPEMLRTVSFEYSKLFGSSAQLIDQQYIRSALVSVFGLLPKFIIYLFFPVLVFLFIIFGIIQSFLTILVLYFVSTIYENKASITNSIRIVLFSSAVVVLLQSIIIVFIPFLQKFLWLMQLWTHILVIVGFLQAIAKNRQI